LKPLFQPRAAFRLNLFYRPGAGCGHDHVRRDVRDDGEAASLWRVRDCSIPVAVLLTFFKSMTPRLANAIKNLNWVRFVPDAPGNCRIDAFPHWA
jgi:hypothetical protein